MQLRYPPFDHFLFIFSLLTPSKVVLLIDYCKTFIKPQVLLNFEGVYLIFEVLRKRLIREGGFL